MNHSMRLVHYQSVFSEISCFSPEKLLISSVRQKAILIS